MENCPLKVVFRIHRTKTAMLFHSVIVVSWYTYKIGSTSICLYKWRKSINHLCLHHRHHFIQKTNSRIQEILWSSPGCFTLWRQRIPVCSLYSCDVNSSDFKPLKRTFRIHISSMTTHSYSKLTSYWDTAVDGPRTFANLPERSRTFWMAMAMYWI